MFRGLLTFGCILVAVSSSPAQVAYYAANGNFLDSSGNGLTATVNGTVGFRPGAFGMGQGFDINNPVNTPPAANFLTVTGLSGAGAANLSGTGLTAAAFFIEDAFANNGSIVNLRDPGNNSGFTMEPAFGMPGSILVGVYTNAGFQQLIVPGFAVGIQHHLTMVFDPINQLISV